MTDERVYYTDEEIAAVLGITVGRLRNKLMAGDPLPPRIQPPGCRHRLWPRSTVHQWLGRYTIGSADAVNELAVSPIGKRGRAVSRRTLRR